MDSEKYYDSIAIKYDQITQKAWHAPAFINNYLKDSEFADMKVLDIGIGTGQSIHAISQETNTIEGIDLSELMLKICKEKYPNLILHHGDFLSYNGFVNKKFDIIICCGVIEFIKDINAFFEKCRTLLKVNGELLLTYEPVIRNHKTQHQSESEVSYQRIPESFNFINYRHEIGQMKTYLGANNFKIKREELFSAYVKSNTDVIYHLLYLTTII